MSESPHPNVTVNSILQLNVDSFEEKFINNKSETVYTINIKNLYNKKKWTIEKTYRDIEMLHSELSKILPQIPSFSSFSLFKSSRSYNTIVERKDEINESTFFSRLKSDNIAIKIFSCSKYCKSFMVKLLFSIISINSGELYIYSGKFFSI